MADGLKASIATNPLLKASGPVLDPKLLYLAFVALATYPLSFPPAVYVTTGADALSDPFRRRYRKFLQALAKSWR